MVEAFYWTFGDWLWGQSLHLVQGPAKEAISSWVLVVHEPDWTKPPGPLIENGLVPGHLCL